MMTLKLFLKPFVIDCEELKGNLKARAKQLGPGNALAVNILHLCAPRQPPRKEVRVGMYIYLPRGSSKSGKDMAELERLLRLVSTLETPGAVPCQLVYIDDGTVVTDDCRTFLRQLRQYARIRKFLLHPEHPWHLPESPRPPST